MEENLFGERTPLQEFSEFLNKLKSEIGKVIVGQGQMIELLIAGILADGHVLIEGVPGCGQNTYSQTTKPIHRCRIFEDSIYARSDAGGCNRSIHF